MRLAVFNLALAPGGLAAGWRTPGGRPVEAGIHGFWREYQNTFAVLDRLGLPQWLLLIGCMETPSTGAACAL